MEGQGRIMPGEPSAEDALIGSNVRIAWGALALRLTH